MRKNKNRNLYYFVVHNQIKDIENKIHLDTNIKYLSSYELDVCLKDYYEIPEIINEYSDDIKTGFDSKKDERKAGGEPSRFNEISGGLYQEFDVFKINKYKKRKVIILGVDMYYLYNNLPKKNNNNGLMNMLFRETKKRKVENILECRTIGEKKLLGRKRKDSLTEGKHNKFSHDNLIRKIKSIILHNLNIFINSTIHEIYKNEPNYDMEKDKLMKIKQEQIVKSNIEFNKNFLEETLEQIFSVDISSKFKKYNPDHNRNLIFKLLNDNNIERRQIFRNLFTKTFLECLEHIRGTKNINELEGINTEFNECYNKDEEQIGYYLDNIENIFKPCYYKCKKCNIGGNDENNNCIECKNDNDYLASLEHMIKVYEIIIRKKKGRKT